MATMQIEARNDFAADAVSTYTMLTDPTFLAAVCIASGDLRHKVDAGPQHSTVERVMSSPSAVRSLLGDTLTLVQDLRWNPSGADGSRTAALTLSVKGMPAKADLVVTLRPGGRGTVVDFKGEFRIRVPLLGAKLESQAAPALLAGFSTQQDVGDTWLAQAAAS